ncbi:MAG: 1-acyl-sn-glycerol-3-phosphate acyltransferase [Bacteroidota bacterium]
MGFNTIERKSYLYGVLKAYLSRAFHMFYKISVEDKSGVEEGEPIIYAPNHQNALIDPLVLLFTRKSQIIFFARSDIFKNKIIAKFLYFIKMLPVFRIRDGYENLHRNQAIFDKTMSVIASGSGLGIFPEANHAGYRKLRSLKKGISRVAFQTELNYNEELNVKIVPVGIEYEHYYWFRSKVHVNYGKAISVKDYIEDYKENIPNGVNKLNGAIRDSIIPLIVNIQFKGNEYEAVDFLTEINFNIENSTEDLSFEDRIKHDQKLVENITRFQYLDEDIFSKIIRKTNEYRKLLKEVRTDDYSVQRVQNKRSCIGIILLLILTFPLYIIGALFNYLPYKLVYMSTRNIEDIQFHGTMYFTLGALVSFPVFYLIYFFVLKSILSVYVALILLVIIGFLGVFSYDYWRLYIKMKRGMRMKKSSKKQKELFRLRKVLVNFLESLR